MIRKKFSGMLAIVLAAAMLLTGCGDIQSDRGGNDSVTGGVKFSEMEYVRPDIDGIEALLKEAESAAQDGDVDELERLVEECSELMDDYYCMYTLSDIHNSLDMTDEYWEDEYYYVMSSETELSAAINELADAVEESSAKRKIERTVWWQNFEAAYVSNYEYSDEALRLSQRESELLADYREIVSDPIIEIEGEEWGLYDYLDQCSYNERYGAIMEYYYQNNERAGEIYIELIDVREKLAAEYGYDSYKQMQFDYYSRDYTPEQADSYIADLKEYMVPVYEKYSRYDNGEYIIEAEISRGLLDDCIWAATGEIGGDVAEIFNFMVENELYDTAVSTVKAPGAYTTYISRYHEPYIYMGASGYADDILTLAHEFGHFTDNYKNGDYYETLDVAECYSLAMEFLVLQRLDIVLEDDDVEALRDYKLLDTLETYVQQASFAEFENRVYGIGADKLTPEILNEISLETAKEYGYFSPGNEDYYAMSWMDITHFIEYPFYVVSYTVSNDVAIQVYEAELRDKGVKLYNKMLNRDSSYFMDFLKECGLKSPFDEGRVEEAADFLLEIRGIKR